MVFYFYFDGMTVKTGNLEVFKKIIMFHTDLQKSEILSKVSSFTHFMWTSLFSYWFEFTYFWRVCQLRLY